MAYFKQVLSYSSLLSVPNRQYEVKVWAISKQVDGAVAVWKGRTEKAHVRRRTPQRTTNTNISCIQ